MMSAGPDTTRLTREGSVESETSSVSDSQRAESPESMVSESDVESNQDRSRSVTPTLDDHDDERDREIEALKQENKQLKRQLNELLEHIKVLKYEAANTKREAEERAAEAKKEAEARHNELLQALKGRHSSAQETKVVEATTATQTTARKVQVAVEAEKETLAVPLEEMAVDEAFTVVRRKRKEVTPEKGAAQQPPKRQARPPTPTKVSSVAAPSASKNAPEKSAVPTKTADVQGTQSAGENKKQQVPPVILRKQERWTMVSQKLAAAKVKYTKAKLVQGTIHITPASPEDHRGMTRMLEQLKEEYHTYSLPDEKQLRVVVRGLPTSITNDEIKADLEKQGFNPSEVLRMKSRKTKVSMPLVLVKLPKEQTGVLEVNRCCYLVVRVELQRKEAHKITQCYRCQSFGHAQSYCTATHRCVKCGDQHASNICDLPREKPATCANCAGAHPASYGGCPKKPKQPRKAREEQKAPNKQATAAPGAPAKQVSSALSFAEAAKKKQVPASQTPVTEDLSLDPTDLPSVVRQMQRMYSAMNAFFAQLKMPVLEGL